MRYFQIFLPTVSKEGTALATGSTVKQQPLKQSSRRLGSSTTVEACPKLSHEFQMSS